MPLIIYFLPFILVINFPVKFYLHYHYRNKEDYFLLEMSFLGLYVWRYQVPSFKGSSPGGTKQLKINSTQRMELKEKTEPGTTIDLNFLLVNISKISSFLKKYGIGGTLFYLFLPRKYQRWVNVAEELENKGVFTRLVWRTVVAKQDPAITGRGLGLLWSIKGMLTGYLQNVYYFKNPPWIMVIPSFTGTDQETLLDCIFEIKLGHIIFAGIKEYVTNVWRDKNNAGTSH